MPNWSVKDDESKDLILISSLDGAVFFACLVAAYFVHVRHARRTSGSLLRGKNAGGSGGGGGGGSMNQLSMQATAESTAAASYGRLATRPKVGFDLGKDSGCKVLTRLWSVDIEVLSVRCGVHAATYLRFTKMLTMLMFYLSLLVVPCVCYFFDRGDGDRKGYESMTLRSLSPKDTHAWWMMTAVVVGVAFVATVFVNQFARHVRLTYLLGRTKAPVSNFGVHITEWPSTACRDKDQQKLFKEFDRQYKGEVVAVHIIPDVGRIMDIELERDNAVDTLEYYQSVPGNPTCREAPIYMLGSTVDAVKHWKQRVAQLDAQLSEARRQHENNPTGTGHVFVTFNEIRSARTCIADIASGKFNLEFKYTGPNDGKVAKVDPSALRVAIAPNPDDIQWRNLGTPPYRHLWRRVVVVVASTLVLAMWTAPVMMLTAAQELSGAGGSIGRTFAGVKSMSGPGATLLFRHLPSLCLYLAGQFLSDLFSVAAKLEARSSRGEQDRSVLKWASTYSICNALVLPFSVLLALGALARHPSSSFGAHSDTAFLTDNGTFFAHFVIHAALWGNGLSLLRPRELVAAAWSSQWLNRITGGVPAVGREASMANSPPFFNFPASYTETVTIFGVALCMAPALPIMLPLGFAYMFVTYWTRKFNFIYVYSNRTTDDGHTPQSAAYVCLHLVAIMESLFALWCLWRGQKGQAATLFCCSGLAELMFIATMLSRRNLSMTPIELGENSIAEDAVDVVALRMAYCHPSVARWQSQMSMEQGHVTLENLGE